MLTLEIWEHIYLNGKKTDYKVSNLGRVKNKKTGKILKTSLNKKGYEKVNIWRNNKVKRCFLHRLVAEAFIENPYPDIFKQVNHIDGNKLNNFATNLEWVTPSDNVNQCIQEWIKEDEIFKKANTQGMPVNRNGILRQKH